MIILEFTEEEVDLIFDYCQDPSGTGPNSKMSEYLDENNLWATYHSAISKLEDARHKEHPFAGLDQRVFAMPEPWYMREPWISVWLLIVALLAGFKVADIAASAFRRWAF